MSATEHHQEAVMYDMKNLAKMKDLEVHAPRR